MLRNRIIHQNELLYVGHALESGQTYSAPIVTNLDKVVRIRTGETDQDAL